MTEPAPRPQFGDVALWGTLQRAFWYLNNATFEAERGDREASLMWIDDARGERSASLRSSSLNAATPHAPGTWPSLSTSSPPPRSDAEAAYIERTGRES